ncbi:MAG: ABC transporter permease [Natronomonas sp.]|uniref:ABC transporter permease n=1 Tax=Natronomonas sp. TaxID=2184060 RepID=UPI0028704634|nr:ABC transporter permease [Natronomonas sp.]MDR9380390.1 ABC transporter permease [Natronomonas sp.]MDR9431395.1 ABC transporter permease [Natronomonas sp.]
MSWTGYALKRVGVSIALLFAASIVVFSIIRLIPGDPAMIILGRFAEEGAAEALRRQLGLHLPFWEQYTQWILGIFKGDWGRSVINGYSVRQTVMMRYPRSLELAILGIGIGIAISFPLGLLGGIKRNSTTDYGALFFSQFGVSIPNFWLGILLSLLFARYLDILPASGYYPFFEDPIRNLKHAFLPALTIGIINAAIFTRYLRSEMLEELGSDYVRTARAFGHSQKTIVLRYVLKNAVLPTITIIGIQFGYMVGGVVIIEKVFSYPGLGSLLLNSLFNRDYPPLQMSLLVLVSTFIFVNLIVDLVYGLLDPKIKY